MSDTLAAPLSLFVPPARHSTENRTGSALTAADLIARLTTGTPPPSGGRRAARERLAEPPAGLTGSFFAGGLAAPARPDAAARLRAAAGARLQSTAGAVAATVPAPLRSARGLAATATVTAIGATAVLTGLPGTTGLLGDRSVETTAEFSLADAATPQGAADPAVATGADLATQALQAVPQQGPGVVGGQMQAAFGTALGTLPQVLDQAGTAQAAALDRIAEERRAAERRAAAPVRAATAGVAGAATSVGQAISGVTGTGAQALAAARTRLGMPYQWGGTGPTAFDCSGLTSWAFAQVGVTIPRTSAAQSTFGTAVSKADLQPGDLVFFYTPVSHVGIYIGNGQVLHASTSGEPVKISNMSDFPFHNARRI